MSLYHPEYAVVAISSIQSNATILWATPVVARDIAEAGIDAYDMWQETELPDHGIWVWEGSVIFYEDDVSYDGKFRKPNQKEWEAIQAGDSPWPLSESG